MWRERHTIRRMCNGWATETQGDSSARAAVYGQAEQWLPGPGPAVASLQWRREYVGTHSAQVDRHIPAPGSYPQLFHDAAARVPCRVPVRRIELAVVVSPEL